MPNEFIIKNGYFSQGNSQITGSLTVTAGITGSLQGTATSASFATTASFATFTNVFTRRSDYTSSLDPNINLLYLGEALTGTSESANEWTISQLSISSSGATTTRSTSSAAWTNRYSYIYS